MELLDSSREITIIEEYTVLLDGVKYNIWMKLDSDDNINDFNVQDEEGYVVDQFGVMERFLEESGLDYWF